VIISGPAARRRRGTGETLLRRLGDDGGPLDEVVQRLVDGARRRVRQI
jgi:hypothetical protein